METIITIIIVIIIPNSHASLFYWQQRPSHSFQNKYVIGIFLMRTSPAVNVEWRFRVIVKGSVCKQQLNL